VKEASLSERSIHFSLVSGGPFHSLLGRFGLLGPDLLPTWRTAFVLALLAWAAPALAAILQTFLHTEYSGWSYFSDPTVYTRYLIAIVAMVATERFADTRISLLVNQFLRARLLDTESREKFHAIVAQSDRQASMLIVEGILLLVALGWSWLSFYFVTLISVSGWEEWTVGAESHMSWAGMTAELMSNPVFLFLMLRWFWRFVVWTVLLARIARLPLRLVAIHPDRAGGLIFLSLFPGIFSGFVFALSCVVSSSLLKTMALDPPSQTIIGFGIFGWVFLMALIFLGPLFFFSPPLYRARERAVIAYGRLAQVHNREFERVWVGCNRDPEELLGSPDPSSVADLTVAVQTALGMRFVPLDLTAALLILFAAMAPFLVVVASQVKLTELLKWILGAIF